MNTLIKNDVRQTVYSKIYSSAETDPAPDVDTMRDDAEKALGAFLKAKTGLGEKGVSRWGGEL